MSWFINDNDYDIILLRHIELDIIDFYDDFNDKFDELRINCDYIYEFFNLLLLFT